METFLAQAKDHLKASRYEEALQAVEQVLKEYPAHLEALYFKGIILRKQKNLSASLDAFELALQKDGENADFYAERAVTYLHGGALNKALSDFEEAISLEPTNSYRYACRAYLKDKMGNTAEAIADYEYAIKLDPEDEVAVNNLEVLKEKLQYEEKQHKMMARNRASYTKNGKNNFEELVKDLEKKEAEQEARDKEQATQSYGSIIKGIFTSGKARKEFWHFIRNGFKLRKDSDS